MKISLLLLAFLRYGCTYVSSRQGSKSYCKTMLRESNPVSFWTGIDCNKKLAFRHMKPHQLGGNKSYDVGRSNTTVMFVNGLLSSMDGTKCNALQRYCYNNDVSFLCFDYRGHGQSSGHFIDCTMHDWVTDASDMLDYIGQESNVILIGSSLGAWISLVLAMHRPDEITAVIGIGSAIDFTSDTYNAKLTDQQRKMWENPVQTSSTSNAFEISSPYLDNAYPFTRELYQSGNDYLICQDNQLSKIAHRDLRCPVRFLHGDEDDVIPYTKIYDAADALQSKHSGTDIAIKLIKGGDHRLSNADDISSLLDTLNEFL
mmetsp:Transcript_27882/g.55855  ORF Transcript_27882/g.55855 Transcript_27882/m.55855 type:complete len:315 (+) Transcript_27882:162-1106(+)